MYRCIISGTDKINQYEELVKEFLRPGEYEIYAQDCDNIDHIKNKSIKEKIPYEDDYVYRYEVCSEDKDEVKRNIYKDLSAYTAKTPKWGILTGIRPVKMAGELYRENGSFAKTADILKNRYMLHEDKIKLVTDTLRYQIDTVGYPERNSLSMYIGIPFCPTRCLYCSFTSNPADEGEIDKYLKALFCEIEYASKEMQKLGKNPESLYIGGGTPTSMSADRLGMLLNKINESFDVRKLKEFTVEAGRPDTITEEKLYKMKDAGVDRISINPQSMNEKTLKIIGRSHTPQDIERAFHMAEKAGFDIINADLIAGLPGEDTDDFRYSIKKVLDLKAKNITLHTLSVKRASRLKEADEFYNYKNEEITEEMLSYAFDELKKQGYRPYYLYRQKHTSGNTENIGFCREDTVSVYNIRIMEEAQSILALGAGGISKAYFHEENRLQRVANVSNYEIYIDRIYEMIERKRKGFFEDAVWR